MTFGIETAGLAPETFAGQVAVVTGAGQGIGQQAARTLAALGARVVVAELTARGAEAADEITAAGGAARFIQTDVADEASVAALFQTAEAELGPVSLLVNNAAYEPVASVIDLAVADWDRAIAVNLRGAFLTSRAALPGMLARRRGVIVNMVTAEAMPGMAAYIASKQGIVGLTRSLAAEVGQQGVQVVALAPGMVDTPGLRHAAERLAPRLGLTPEAFLGVSLHAAYDGLMPASHAAAAAAFLMARLAQEFHGEVVTGYAVLERAGVIAPAAAPTAPAASAPEAETPAGDRGQQLAEALNLAQQLESLLVQTEAEFDMLPVFVRPLARGGFKSKTGQAIPEGRNAMHKLSEQLKRMQGTHAVGDAEFAVDYPRMAGWLTRLGAYYEGVPAETARFTRDAATLEMIRRQSVDRAALIRRLLATLAPLVSGA